VGQWCFVAVSSQRGALNITLTCVDPIISPARARALLSGLVRRLLADQKEAATPAAAAAAGPVDAVGRVQGEVAASGGIQRG
jgi:hypothetical protein